MGAGEKMGTGEEIGAGDEERCGEDGGKEKMEEETPRFSKKFSKFFFLSAVMDTHLFKKFCYQVIC